MGKFFFKLFFIALVTTTSIIIFLSYFGLETDKFDDLFSSEGEQRFMKDQDQIISRDIIRVIWR